MSENASQLKTRFTTGKTVTSESMNAMVDALAVSSTTKETLKSYFETGDKPTQAQFYELIDAIFEQQTFDALNWIDATSYIYSTTEITRTITFKNQNAINFDQQNNSILVYDCFSNYYSSSALQLQQLFGHTLATIATMAPIVGVKFTMTIKVGANQHIQSIGTKTYEVTMPYIFQQTSLFRSYATRTTLRAAAHAFASPIGLCNTESFGFTPYNDLMLYANPFIMCYDNLNQLSIGATFAVMNVTKPPYEFDFINDGGGVNVSVPIVTKITKASVLNARNCTTIVS